ncbi:nicotinate phosphoribosyltransferase, partial [Campylobacter coli]|nr:nicotinate phosphoribosyltransferase [Campylobacter coli]
SEDKQKITLPHFKKLFRIYDKNTQKMLFDELYIYNEKLPKLDENLERKELLKCVFKEGKILNKQKNVEEIALYAKSQISKLDEKFLNFNNKEKYKIKLSKDLTKLRQNFTNTTL